MALYTQNNPEYFGEGHTGPAENAMKWSNIMPKYAGQLLPYLSYATVCVARFAIYQNNAECAARVLRRRIKINFNTAACTA